MALWLVSLVFALVSALDQCPYCKPNTLCPKHLEKEQTVLRDTKKALQSNVPAERSAALVEIASLNDEHVNAPSKRVAETLAQSLDDETPSVRQVAADLLAESRRPDVAIPELSRVVDASCSEALKNRSGGAGRGNMRSTGDLSDRDRRAEEIRRSFVDVSGALARLKDDRSVRMLVETFERYSALGIDDPSAKLAGQLASLGTRNAIAPIVDAIDKNEKKFFDAQQARKPTPPEVAFLESLHVALISFAESRRLGGAPEWKPDVGARWRAWIKKNADSIPKSLGTLEVGAAKPSKG